MARVDETELLARAVAHEVGHLLIQSNRHASGGLMRATWTVEELQLNRPRDWSFSDAERQVMRKAVAVAAAAREPEAVSTRNSAASLDELR